MTASNFPVPTGEPIEPRRVRRKIDKTIDSYLRAIRRFPKEIQADLSR